MVILLIDKKRQSCDNKDIRPFQGRGTVARQRNGGGFYPRRCNDGFLYEKNHCV